MVGIDMVHAINVIAGILFVGSILLLILLFAYYICIIVDSAILEQKTKKKLNDSIKKPIINSKDNKELNTENKK